jgi:hypothetical protein
MDLSRAIWRKATQSQGDNNNCVEVARNLPDMVGVRDSKIPTGPVLAVTPEEWCTFIGGIKRGDFGQ